MEGWSPVPEWDDRFDALLREHLSGLAPETPLRADDDLRGLGLDSMAMVQVLLDVEQAYQVMLPDDALSSSTFSTPQTLWNAVRAAEAS